MNPYDVKPDDFAAIVRSGLLRGLRPSATSVLAAIAFGGRTDLTSIATLSGRDVSTVGRVLADLRRNPIKRGGKR